ncbi:UDP-glycosyltransferase UGT5-like [Vanessa tameamea]|uniref:UDP-glycosyltransferase UGT5-like n=1 Tax=Vanessa tameamea TaxID=334116 RepID=A0ABM4ATL0_VANTA
MDWTPQNKPNMIRLTALVSFGTNVSPSLLPPEKIQMFVNVFSHLPYDVLLKCDKDVLPGKSENIKIFKWLPQSDVLRHPNLKLFINQGGLQSTDEAISAGVPLIGIPMLGDQWYNAEKYVLHKIGIRLDLASLSENEFRSAIEKITTDNSYRDNIVRLRILMEDKPQSPLERAVWWTEHVLRHGGAKHLRAAGANISWAEYLELVLIVLIALFSILLIMSLSIYML